MLDAEWTASVINQNLTKAQLTKEVSDVFYRILVLQEKKKYWNTSASCTPTLLIKPA
jgi:hypothetical protein